MGQIHKRALLLLLILAIPSSAGQADSAVERFQSLQEKLQKSRSTNDWQSSLATARELEQFLNGSPNSLLETARAEMHVNDLTSAARKLEEFVRMGQSTGLIETSAEFAPLHEQARFSEIQNGMKANRSPISLGSMAFGLTDSALLAEDLDYDRDAKRFFVTSVRQKRILSTDESGASREFAKAPDHWPVLAIKIDRSRGLLWATEVALQGFIFAPKEDWGRSAVLCYDLKSGRLLRRIEGPHPGALGDMTLAANGDVFVSDGGGGGVYRVLAKGDALERVDAGDFISPQTPVMHPDGKHIFVPDYVRGIGLLEIASKQVRWLSTEGRFALNGIDGLYFDGGKLFAVQNGTSPERVVSFKLDATLTTIVSATIIERSTPTLGDPTHGVIVDDGFYYLANSGWDVIDDHGSMKLGAIPSEARIMRVQVKGL
jgi:sugar lactone lactonase YvrE